MTELKTLKGIIVELSGGTRVYPMAEEGEIPNTDDKIYLDAIGILERRLREAAKEWLNVFKKNREMDQDDEPGIDEAFVRIFFNLEDEDK